LLALIVTLLPIGTASGQTRPAPPPADQFAVPGRPGWSVDARSGCWVWNASPTAGATVAWSGLCRSDGPATGRGVLEWRWEDKGERKVSWYEGEYRDGRAHWRGVYTYANGDRYDGEFRDSRASGRGVYTFAGGNRYDGEWRDGKKNGRGVYTSVIP
jgi:hypothetical protein